MNPRVALPGLWLVGALACSRTDLELGGGSAAPDAAAACEACDATLDSGAMLDALKPIDVEKRDVDRDVAAFDAGPDISAEVGADAGGVECGDASCGAGDFCLVLLGPECSQFGATCVTNFDCCSGYCCGGVCGVPGPDSGLCPDASAPTDTYECEPLPASCNGIVSCACAAQVPACPFCAYTSGDTMYCGGV